jgi:glucose-6-phosphate isomerase
MGTITEKHAAVMVTDHPAWKALEAHYRTIATLHLRELFANDPKRGERLTTEAVGIYFDYSKTASPTKLSSSS